MLVEFLYGKSDYFPLNIVIMNIKIFSIVE